MQRLHIFIIILITTIGVLVSLAVVAWYLSVTAPSYYGSSWMSQMWGNHLGASGNYGGMGGMMGDGSGSNGTSTITSYLWIVPVLLIVASAVAVIGIVFYLVFPELRYIKRTGACNPQEPKPIPSQITSTSTTDTVSPASAAPAVSSVSSIPNSCEVLLKTMTPEEQKVLNVLISHQGKYLQKYVVKEAGFSRLQTHRIVARFAQRGIVTVNEFGNTNEIILSDWVKGSNTPKTNVL